MKLIKQDVTINFLQWLISSYGYDVSRSYREMAADAGSICFMTVKYHVSKLENMGVIAIENKGTGKQVLHISVEKAKKLVQDNPLLVYGK